MKAIIFVGGTGTRLWPLSRQKSPKQFQSYIHEKTMFQLAVDRLVPEFSYHDIFISTGKVYEEDLLKQVPDLIPENIILEPALRDVGPAVGLLAAIFAKRYPNETIAILWGGDHVVKDEAAFRKMLMIGEDYLKRDQNKIIFFAQRPRFASENLGWIEIGERLDTVDGVEIHDFKQWKYRPSRETAAEYFADGKHMWNPGYFVVNTNHLWDLFKKHAPEMFAKLKVIQDAVDTPVYESVLEAIYPTLDKVTFDNAVIERIPASDAVVLIDDFGWSDVGAWEQLKEALEESRHANVTRGKVILQDSHDTLAFNYEEEKTVMGIDLDEFIVVNTPDVLLITKKTSVGKIKELLTSLKGTDHEKLT